MTSVIVCIVHPAAVDLRPSSLLISSTCLAASEAVFTYIHIDNSSTQ